MNGRHWTDQQLIDHIYGIGPEDGHLSGCPECQGRWSELSTRRQAVLEPPAISHEILAEQRRSIYRRLDRNPGDQAVRWMPALAAVLLLLVGFFFVRPVPTVVAPQPASISDSQLMTEIYALEQSSEPSVASPMRSLFEEN